MSPILALGLPSVMVVMLPDNGSNAVSGYWTDVQVTHGGHRNTVHHGSDGRGDNHTAMTADISETSLWSTHGFSLSVKLIK